jgi:hypothetical protein
MEDLEKNRQLWLPVSEAETTQVVSCRTLIFILLEFIPAEAMGPWGWSCPGDVQCVGTAGNANSI